jgi:hypothetical protein
MDTTYCMLLGFVVLLVAWGVKEGVIPLWNKQTKLTSCSWLGRSWRTRTVCERKKERKKETVTTSRRRCRYHHDRSWVPPPARGHKFTQCSLELLRHFV